MSVCKTNNPNYYAIIPASIRYDKKLKANEKLLYGEITALTQSTGRCFASNAYFSNLYNVSKTSVSKWISNLEKLGYIKTVLEYKEDTKEILNRYITIIQYPIEEKLNTPIEEKLKDNITSINITSNNKEKIQKKEIVEAEVIKPTLKDKKEELVFKTIDYINHKCNKKYRYTAGNKKEIAAQINKLVSDSDTLEEIELKFKHVIDVKHQEWHNSDMAKNLNPITLFREANFDRYLNQDLKQNQQQGVYFTDEQLNNFIESQDFSEDRIPFD